MLYDITFNMLSDVFHINTPVKPKKLIGLTCFCKWRFRRVQKNVSSTVFDSFHHRRHDVHLLQLNLLLWLQQVVHSWCIDKSSQSLLENDVNMKTVTCYYPKIGQFASKSWIPWLSWQERPHAKCDYMLRATSIFCFVFQLKFSFSVNSCWVEWCSVISSFELTNWHWVEWELL